MIRRTDANQKTIVAGLRDLGASVLILAGVGSGCPDLLIGWRGSNFLAEIKNLAGRGDRYTDAERTFLDTWHGQVEVVRNVAEALALLGVGT